MPLLKYPAPSLLLPSLPVTPDGFENGAVQVLTAKLHQMREDAAALGAADAVALAAPQIGVNLRVFVWQDDDESRAMVNPVIESADGSQFGEEACLSFLGQYSNVTCTWSEGLVLQVRRPERVVVTGQNVEGEPMLVEAQGFVARMFCHEVDHLDGLTILDRVSAPVRKQALKRWDRIHVQTSRKPAGQILSRARARASV